MKNIPSSTVFGRVDLSALYAEWENDTELASYKEPLSGWKLKYSYVFQNDICVLLFEHLGKRGVTYYRVLYYGGENESFELLRKQRFREKDGLRIDALGIDQKLSSVFYIRSSKSVNCDICGDTLTEDALIINERAALKDTIVQQSDRKFALVDGNTVLFIKTPECINLVIDRDCPYDFFQILSKSGNDNNEEDDDDYDFNDEDEDDDDTECRAEVRKLEVAADKTAMEELQNLIGLENIKEQVSQITAFARLRKLAKEHGKEINGISLNLAFVGNPGTAKTTVARLFAQIMKENGLLSNGDLIETGRADLVAKYTGQTAIKVKEVFKKAKGNVLFIDEAYSLVDNWENEYGDEAIATIVQEMENNRDDLIVIFAGYPDKMENFLSRNPGLRSRVPFVVEFPDYSADELTEIVRLEAQIRGYSIAPAAKRKIHDICAAARRTEEFGNGRFSRNLVEAAMMNSAARIMQAACPEAELSSFFRLESCDFALPDNLKKEERTCIIGFSAA